MRNAAKIKFTIPANAGISARKTPEKKAHPIPAKRPKKKVHSIPANAGISAGETGKKVHSIPANAGISAEIPIYIGTEAGEYAKKTAETRNPRRFLFSFIRR